MDYGEHVKITCYLIYFHSEKSSDALMLLHFPLQRKTTCLTGGYKTKLDVLLCISDLSFVLWRLEQKKESSVASLQCVY